MATSPTPGAAAPLLTALRISTAKQATSPSPNPPPPPCSSPLPALSRSFAAATSQQRRTFARKSHDVRRVLDSGQPPAGFYGPIPGKPVSDFEFRIAYRHSCFGYFLCNSCFTFEYCSRQNPPKSCVICTGRLFGANICTNTGTRPIAIDGVPLTPYNS